MNQLKSIFTSVTGYYLHKVATLPVGTNLYVDIHKRIGYGPLKVIFDVGANIGQSWQEFRKNEPRSFIYCFEPISGAFSRLVDITHKDPKCITERSALANFIGKKSVSIFDETSALNSLKDELIEAGNTLKKEVVQVNTLDNYCVENRIGIIDLLKIDTEGFELEVLKGSEQRLLTGKISFIYAEVGFNKRDNRHTSFQSINDLLQDYGYLFFGLYQLAGHAWKNGGYYGNALFVHEKVYNPK